MLGANRQGMIKPPPFRNEESVGKPSSCVKNRTKLTPELENEKRGLRAAPPFSKGRRSEEVKVCLAGEEAEPKSL